MSSLYFKAIVAYVVVENCYAVKPVILSSFIAIVFGHKIWILQFGNMIISVLVNSLNFNCSHLTKYRNLILYGHLLLHKTKGEYS